jgi:hypothetical protein
MDFSIAHKQSKLRFENPAKPDSARRVFEN